MQTTKKPSLFKQKIKQAKQTYKPLNEGFPKPLNILTLTSESKDHHEEVSISKEEPNKRSLIDLIKEQKVLKEEDMSKIEGENWKRIQEMTEQQRNTYMTMINSQLPKNFLKKLKKQQVKPNQTNEIKEPKQDNEQTAQEEDMNNDGTMIELLLLDIKENKLFYKFEAENNDIPAQNLVSLASIKLMLQSDNNQSQIVGSKLFAQIIKQLTQSATSKSKQLIFIGTIPMHMTLVIQDITQILLPSFLKQLKITTFKSVFVELLSQLAQIITLGLRYMKKEQTKILHEFIKNMIEKIKKYEYDQKIIRSLVDTLTNIQQLFVSNQQERQFNWNSQIISIDSIIELTLIEETVIKNYDIVKYSERMVEQIQKDQRCRILDQGQAINFLYLFTRKLIIKKNNFKYIDLQRIKNLYENIFNSVWSFNFQVLTNLEPKKRKLLYQQLFISKFQSINKYQKKVQQISANYKVCEEVQHLFIYFAISEYNGRDISKQEVELVDEMVKWLVKMVKEYGLDSDNSNILSDLIDIFLNQNQIYSQLDQDSLDQLLSLLTVNANLTFLDESTLRILISNYNYNSFGNDIFTKLMLYFATHLSDNIQAMIIREVMLAYPFLFYYAYDNQGMKVYGSKQKYKFNGRNSQVKEEVKQMLSGMKKIVNNLNIFVQFLTTQSQ